MSKAAPLKAPMLNSAQDMIRKFAYNSRYIVNIDELTHDLFATTKELGVHQGHFIRYKKSKADLEIVKIDGSVNTPFTTRYDGEHMSRIDPFIRRAVNDLAPFTWDQVSRDEADNEDTQYFIQVCKDNGMADGFVIPSHDHDGTLGIVTFKGKGISTNFDLHPHLEHLAMHYRAGIKRIVDAQEPQPTEAVLTPRQLEVIKWIAAGKSDWETGAILGLSQATVNRHVELAKERLGVSTRIQVVVHALTTGLIGF
jgi:DNA-binding CsgD family transcriptional regulator